MTTTHSNLVEGRGRRVVLLVLPMVLLPLGLAGVTMKPVLDLRAAAGHVKDAELRAAETESLRAQLSEAEPLEATAARALVLDQALRKLVPGELGSLELYSVLRSAATTAQFALNTLQVSDPEPFQQPLDGRAIGRREVLLKGAATTVAVGAFVDRLRAVGLPTAVESFVFSRKPNSLTFDVELRLAVFHRIPPAAATLEDSPVDGGEPAPQ